jgi:hypothetical protein
MKAALLCNGPSRELFTLKESYEFFIGCNVPWTNVDATVVLDKEVIDKWAKNPDLIQCATYFSVDAWRYTDSIKKRDLFRPYLMGLVTPKFPYHSSGHNAAEILIKLGYTDIDIYGCDSYFSNTTQTYTRSIITKKHASDGSMKHIIGWRNRWNEIIQNNPNIRLNFIGYDNIYSPRYTETKTY